MALGDRAYSFRIVVRGRLLFWRKLWLLVRGRAEAFRVSGKDQSQRDQTEIENAEVETAWCAVANVVMER